MGRMSKLPTLFLSHGAPNLALRASPTRAFLEGLGASLPRPDAILVMSAHFEAPEHFVVANEKPDVIYDFSGFEQELYSMRYEAPGAMALALEAADLAAKAGFKSHAATGRGFDHGTWVPLRLAYPQADIPVAQIAIERGADGRHHADLGLALSSLREKNVLIVGSGALTHNLRAYFRGGYAKDAPAPAWVDAFGDWICDRATAGDLDSIADTMVAAPHAQENHPSDEHFLPLPFAMGAAGPGGKGTRLYAGRENGVLLLDAYRFD